MIELRNEDCFVTMGSMRDDSIDVVLTSPFYNTNKKARKDKTLLNAKPRKGREFLRYDVHVDNMTNDEYCEFTVNLFDGLERILKPNGCVLYNLSYGSENTEGMFRAVSAIIERTVFTIADVISWKKSTAIPNSVSPNKLTRIMEYVFVFCRRGETQTFHCNKSVVSVRKSGQRQYESIQNLIEAKNNDGPCPYNKATYSSDLCMKLLALYAPSGGCVYDPFMGSGTTAVACARMGLSCIGSEISSNQVAYAEERLAKESQTALALQINGDQT